MSNGRCETPECETGDPPSKEICDQFFEKVGGRKNFQKQNFAGAKITINGEQHECSTEEGPGEFGWCKVRYLSICTGCPIKNFWLKNSW